MNKYPIYIISKGRWENPQTVKLFEKDKIPYRLVIEPQEYDKYITTVSPKNIIKLPFSNLGLGSYPARNFCWEHSMEQGHEKHFIFDDNIRNFRKLNKGKRTRVNGQKAIKALEKLSDSFTNLAIAGFNYSWFITSITPKAMYINTHVYSALLIRNDIPFRWRMKYNEDVDLCLQALHNKWCTLLLNFYTIEKTSTTAKMKGGNQTELYQNNDLAKKALKTKSLEQVWPQYVKTVYRFNRPHHQVLWNKHFKHPLIRKVNVEV